MSIEVAVRAKNVRTNLQRELAEVGGISRRIRESSANLCAVLAKQERQCVGIAVEHPGEACACRPSRGWLLVQSRPRLVRRIPRTARIGKRQAPNVAGDLFALQCGQAMEARAGDNAAVGKVEVLQVASILRVTVRTMRLNPGTIWKA